MAEKMVSPTTLHDLAQTACLTTEASFLDFDLLRSNIFNITMQAFLADVLTLERMRSVIQAVCSGVTDNTNAPNGLGADTLVLAHRGAYQGLCSAAGQGLAAAGLAFTQFFKFHGSSLSGEVSGELVRETLALKQQIDQITQYADWRFNSDVTRLQAHGVEQLLLPNSSQTTQTNESSMSWTERFFQEAADQPRHAKSNTNASLMLLGLLTSGALLGLREAQAAK
jgi:hypothetical protein